VNGFDPLDYLSPKNVKRMDRFAQFAVACARMAVEDAELSIDEENTERIGAVIGSTIGGMNFAEEQHSILMEKGLRRVSPFLATSLYAGSASNQVAIELAINGYNTTISTACAAGTDAIGHAFHVIRNDMADIILSGGADAPICPLTYGAFCALRALSTGNEEPDKSSRPFDAKRDGFVLSEGAGILILEELNHASSRDAQIYAEVVGYGTSCDAYHMTSPEPTGVNAARAVKIALDDASIEPYDIDYINAHGTATLLNDKVETAVIKKVFGEQAYKIPVSSTKSMIGHLMGAAGSVELIGCTLAIENNMLPPTINYEHHDPECDLDYVPNKARQCSIDIAMSNSFGFGGSNAVIVVTEFKN
jgi:3-oxoacyl-[acyl-carrier-protein] synthase II